MTTAQVGSDPGADGLLNGKNDRSRCPRKRQRHDWSIGLFNDLFLHDRLDGRLINTVIPTPTKNLSLG